MPNTPVPAAATSLPETQPDLSRRVLLVAIPAAAIGIGAPKPAAAATLDYPDADLVVTARAATAALRHFCDASELCDSVQARNEGREVRPEDEAAAKAAFSAYLNARRAVLTAQPKSAQGIRAIFEFLKSDPSLEDDAELEVFIDCMLASAALAIGGANGLELRSFPPRHTWAHPGFCA